MHMAPVVTDAMTEPPPVARERVSDASTVTMSIGNNRGSIRSIDRSLQNNEGNVNLEMEEENVVFSESSGYLDRSDINDVNENKKESDGDIATDQENEHVQTTLPLETKEMYNPDPDEIERDSIHSTGTGSSEDINGETMPNRHAILESDADSTRQSVIRVFHHVSETPDSKSTDNSDSQGPYNMDDEEDISDDSTSALNTTHFISNIDDDSRTNRPPTNSVMEGPSTDLSDIKPIVAAEDTDKSQENTRDVKPTPFDVMRYVLNKLKQDHQEENNSTNHSIRKTQIGNDNKTATVSPSQIDLPIPDAPDIQTNHPHNQESNVNTIDNHDLSSDSTKDYIEGSNGFPRSGDTSTTTTKYEDMTNKNPKESRTDINIEPPVPALNATPFHETKNDNTHNFDAKNDREDIDDIFRTSEEINMNIDARTNEPISGTTEKERNAELKAPNRTSEHDDHDEQTAGPPTDILHTHDINQRPIKLQTPFKHVEQEDTNEEISVVKQYVISQSDPNEAPVISTSPILLSPTVLDKETNPLQDNSDIPSLTDYPFPPYIYSDSYEEPVYSEPRSESEEIPTNEQNPTEILNTKTNRQTHVSPNMDGDIELPGDIKFAKETNIPNLLDFQPNFQDTVDVPTSNAYSEYRGEIDMERSSKDTEGPNTDIMQPTNNEDPINEDRRQFMQEFINSFHRNRNQYYDNQMYPDMDSIWHTGDTYPFDYAPFYTDSYDTMYGGYMRTRFETDSGIFIKPTPKRNSTESKDVTKTLDDINDEIDKTDTPNESESVNKKVPKGGKDKVENTIILETEIDYIETENSFEQIVISSEVNQPQPIDQLNEATTPATINTLQSNDIHQIKKENLNNNKPANNEPVPSVNDDIYTKVPSNPIEKNHHVESAHPDALMPDENERVHNVIKTPQKPPFNGNIPLQTETEITRSEDILAPDPVADIVYDDIVTTPIAYDASTEMKNGSDPSIVKTKERSGSRENVLTFGLIVAGICLGSAFVLGLCIAVALICRKKKRRVSVAPRPTLAIAHARRELLQTDDPKPSRGSLLNRDPTTNKRSNTKSHDTYARGLGHQSVLDVDNLYAAKPPPQKEKGVQVDIHDRPTGVIMRPLFRIESDSDSDISLCEVHPYSMVNKHSKGVQTLTPYELQQTICSSRKKIRGMSPPFTLRRKKIIRPQGSQTVSGGINDLNGGSAPYSAVNTENTHSPRKQYHEYQPQIHHPVVGQRHMHCAATVNANNKTIMKKIYKPSTISETAAVVPERILTSSGQTAFDTSLQGSYYKEPNPDSDVESDWDMQSVLSF